MLDSRHLVSASIAMWAAVGCVSEGVAPPPFHGSGSAPTPGDNHGFDNPKPGAMIGFSWVIDGQLAGMPRPSNADLAFLDEQQIHRLITLTKNPLDPEALAKYKIVTAHIPVPDYHAPTLDQFVEIVTTISGWRAEGQPVGIHCTAGLGRTGTAIAGYFVWQGMTAKQAINEIRKIRPGSIETAEQEQSIYDFEKHLVDHPELQKTR